MEDKNQKDQQDLSMDNKDTEQASFLHKLKDKWKLSSITQVVLVLITFSVGGSACGIMTGKIMSFFSMSSKSPLWWILYVILATIIWPITVYLVSYFFGQQKFFKDYITKIGKKIFGKNKSRE